MSKPGFDRSSDSGFKWDGEMVMIEVDKGRARMKKRNGKFRKGVTDSKSRFSILAEEMKNVEGEVVAYILIRVKFYNNFIPFHNGPSLRLFCRKKNVKINGIPLCGPLVYDPVRVFENETGTYVNFKIRDGDVTQLPVDGFILRGEKQDLYNKFTWTVDMNYDPEMEEMLFDHFDRKTTILEPPCGGLWEFRVEVSDNAISLVPMRERKDKIHENTLDQVKETIAFALEQF